MKETFITILFAIVVIVGIIMAFRVVLNIKPYTPTPFTPPTEEYLPIYNIKSNGKG
jgi:hypothetical protein